MVERKTTATYVCGVLKYLVLICFALMTLLPFINLVAKSFSDDAPVIAGRVGFIPVDPTLATYSYVLKGNTFFNAFKVSVFITLFGSLCSIIITSMQAYPLSRTHFRGRKPILYMWVFLMLFSGGMVPNYMLYRILGMMDTIPVLIFPHLLSVYNMFLIKNYFESLPDSLEEAARIDGATNMTVLFKIILPVSLPMLATITLFYAVSYWNDYFTARMYISTTSRRPLQLYLYDLINNAMQLQNQGEQGNTGSVNEDEIANLTAETVRSAAIVLSTVPILVVYPFLQKYFVTGMVVGSVKG